jgi:hypothetical protein
MQLWIKISNLGLETLATSCETVLISSYEAVTAPKVQTSCRLAGFCLRFGGDGGRGFLRKALCPNPEDPLFKSGALINTS